MTDLSEQAVPLEVLALKAIASLEFTERGAVIAVAGHRASRYRLEYEPGTGPRGETDSVEFLGPRPDRAISGLVTQIEFKERARYFGGDEDYSEITYQVTLTIGGEDIEMSWQESYCPCCCERSGVYLVPV